MKSAEGYLGESADFLVVNGDSFMEIDIPGFLRFHRQHRGLVSMAVRKVPDAARFGTVHMDASNEFLDSAKRPETHRLGLLMPACTCSERSVLKLIPQGPSSLEKDLFPKLLTQGMYALEQDGIFIDIGTPEDYARAQQLYQNCIRPRSPHRKSSRASDRFESHSP